jgi:thymidylate synthase (FAD)
MENVTDALGNTMEVVTNGSETEQKGRRKVKIVEQSHRIMDYIDGQAILNKIEDCGRTCYQSFDKKSQSSAEKFVRMIIKNGHLSVLEHVSITVKFITDRGVLAEMTRHRLASYSVESTRYCNYSKDGFGSEITVIQPCFLHDLTSATQHDTDKHFGFSLNGEPNTDAKDMNWYFGCRQAEEGYFNMLDCGCTPQEARSVLPMSLKTEIVMTANLREWREVFNQRCDSHAHPQMRALMLDTLQDFHHRIPVIFDDLYSKFFEKEEKA